MTRSDIIQAFAKWPNVQQPFFGGLIYDCPSKDYMEGVFYASFRAWLGQEGVLDWTIPWECRDFARAYATLAQVANSKNASRPNNADACAVGEVWFHPDSQPVFSDHAINVMIIDGKLIFIDPQNNTEWPMSETEMQSITFLRF